MKPFEAVGTWWEPTAPDRRLVGRLRVGSAKGIDLCLYAQTKAVISGWQKRKNVTLFGELGQDLAADGTDRAPHIGEKVTLGSCEWAGEAGGLDDAPLSIRLSVPIGFVGAHLPDWTSVKFHRAVLGVRGLDEWVGPLGLSSAWGRRDAYRLRYVPPKDLEAQLGGVGIALKFRIRAPLSPHFHRSPEHNVRTTAWLEVTGLDATFEEVSHARIGPLGELVTFSTGRRSPVTYVSLYSHGLMREQAYDEESEQFLKRALAKKGMAHEIRTGTYKQEVHIAVLHRNFMAFDDEEPETRERGERLPFSMVRRRWPNVVRRWFDLQDSAREALDCLLARDNARWLYADSDFLFAFQAVESMHGSLFRADPARSRARTRQLARVLAVVEDRDADAVREAFKRLAGPSARERIERMIVRHRSLISPLLGDHHKLFVRWLLNTRNNYAHGRSDPKRPAAPYHTVWMLVTILRLLVIAEVLKQLGVTAAARLRICRSLPEYGSASINVEWLAGQLARESAK